MPLDVDAMAAEVVLLIKSALAPFQERIAVLEKGQAMSAPVVVDLAPLRERLAVIEHLQSVPVPVLDMVPLQDRIAALEQRPTAPVAPDAAVGDLLKDHNAIRERLAVLETKAAQTPPEARVEPDTALVDLRARVASLEPHAADLAALRERLAVLETKAPVAGPDGKDGDNGLDGMGWDDLKVDHDGERAFTFQLIRGEQLKSLGTFAIPAMIYRGVWRDGVTAQPGDVYSYGRAMWHCSKTTVLKPDGITRDPLTGEAKGAQGKDFWTMCAGPARDGRDGKDAPGALPVVRTR